jgi:pilus assembly protein Flp/PilA
MFTKLYCAFAARMKSEEGATAVEYGVMVALIAAVIIAVVTAIGTNLITIFNKVIVALGGTAVV